MTFPIDPTLSLNFDTDLVACRGPRVSIFREKISNPELGTTRKNISEPGIPGSNPGTRNYPEIVPSSNPELRKTSGSNREPGKISGFQPGTRNLDIFPGWNPEKIPGWN